LYGSEAGRFDQYHYQKIQQMPLFSADVFTTSWLETIDLGVKLNVGKKATALLGLNYFRYNQKIDNDGDNFTDVTLRIEFPFSKWTFDQRKSIVYHCGAWRL
jgi:outer membrane receptor for ferrienterochelin and colicins